MCVMASLLSTLHVCCYCCYVLLLLLLCVITIAAVAMCYCCCCYVLLLLLLCVIAAVAMYYCCCCYVLLLLLLCVIAAVAMCYYYCCCSTDINCLTIGLLNVHSLVHKLKHTQQDNTYETCDIACFTGTWFNCNTSFTGVSTVRRYMRNDRTQDIQEVVYLWM